MKKYLFLVIVMAIGLAAGGVIVHFIMKESPPEKVETITYTDDIKAVVIWADPTDNNALKKADGRYVRKWEGHKQDTGTMYTIDSVISEALYRVIVTPTSDTVYEPFPNGSIWDVKMLGQFK